MSDLPGPITPRGPYKLYTDADNDSWLVDATGTIVVDYDGEDLEAIGDMQASRWRDIKAIEPVKMRQFPKEMVAAARMYAQHTYGTPAYQARDMRENRDRWTTFALAAIARSKEV